MVNNKKVFIIQIVDKPSLVLKFCKSPVNGFQKGISH